MGAAIMHIFQLGKQAQGDRPRLYSLGRGQGGTQDCGLRAKLTPSPNSPSPSTPPPSHTLAPWLVPGLSLEGLAWGPGWAVAGGLNEATLPGNLLGSKNYSIYRPALGLSEPSPQP